MALNGIVYMVPFTDEFDALICSGCVSPTAIRPKAFVDWTRVVKPGESVLKDTCIHLSLSYTS